ncbi:MAG: hypothetical protein KIT49_04630 [Nitrospira sp.]|nr:hypothetical protein [Nitrospira sp.]MCW5786766.1 hypothetical protein [Nitrospira sp.]
MLKRILAVGAVLLMAGCAARGFDRGALRQQMAQETPPHITSSDIQRALELKPQLKFPFRLAVYMQPGTVDIVNYERTPHSAQPLRVSVGVKDWRWEGDDKNQILSLADKLKSDGVISDMFIIPQARVSRNDIEGIRLAAAEHGADAVLVVNGIADVDRYNNYSAFLYLTVVGLWLVPGTHAESLFVLDGAMWDVKNQYLYLSVESEGLASKMGPQLVLQDKESVTEAKRLALQSFGPELANRLKAITAFKQ